MGLYPLEQKILKTWKSLKFLQEFLENEFDRINRDYFEDKLPRAKIRIKRTWLVGKHPAGKQAAAHYKRAEPNQLAEIHLLPLALLGEHEARIALTHEMIHHWEASMDKDSKDLKYPELIDESITKQFMDSKKEYQWRQKHASGFIKKACIVASALDINVEELLFRRK